MECWLGTETIYKKVGNSGKTAVLDVILLGSFPTHLINRSTVWNSKYFRSRQRYLSNTDFRGPSGVRPRYFLRLWFAAVLVAFSRRYSPAMFTKYNHHGMELRQVVGVSRLFCCLSDIEVGIFLVGFLCSCPKAE